MKKSTLFTPFLILLALLCSFASCKKEEKNIGDRQENVNPPDKQETKSTYHLLRDSGLPGEWLQISTNGKFNADTINVSIGEKQVTMYKLNDTLATFRIPALPSGKITFDLSGIGSNQELSFYMEEYVPIIEPDAVSQVFMDETDQLIEDLKNEDDPAMTSTLKGLKQVFLSEYGKLTEQEKTEVAYALRRLNDTTRIRQLGNTVGRMFYPARIADSHQEDFEDKALKFIAYGGLAYGLTATGVSLLVITTPTFVEKVVGVASLIAGLKLVKPAVNAFKDLADVVSQQINFSGIQDWVVSYNRTFPGSSNFRIMDDDSLVFKYGKKLNLKISSEYKSLSKENLNQSAFFNTIFSVLDGVSDGYNKIKSGIDEVRTWGSFFSSTIPALPAFESPVPDNPKTEKRLTPASEIIIENISARYIQLITEAHDDVLSISINAPISGGSTNFTFDMVYQDEKMGINNRKTIQATLEPVIDSTGFYEQAVLGKWLVTNNVNNPGDFEELELFENGEGLYENKYRVRWHIRRSENNKYYLVENGFWTAGQVVITKDTLPNSSLTYPLTQFYAYVYFPNVGNPPDPPRKGFLYIKQ